MVHTDFALRRPVTTLMAFAAVAVIGSAAELVELFVSALCLTAIHLLNKENRDRNVTDARLRLVEAAVPPPPPPALPPSPGRRRRRPRASSRPPLPMPRSPSAAC